ncbi:hypothetical protein ES707_12167 [subsurface metagenome]
MKGTGIKLLGVMLIGFSILLFVVLFALEREGAVPPIVGWIKYLTFVGVGVGFNLIRKGRAW